MTDDSRLTPSDIQSVQGHSEAIAPFLRAWDSGRAAGAWLLSGPNGIGKATAGHALARFVLINQGTSDQEGAGLFGDDLAAPSYADPLDPDPSDPLAQRIRAGGHGGLKIVERTFSDAKMTKRRTQIRVDEVRELGGFLSMTPSEGTWRVILIDAADELNTSAANAVLKGLEEPPDNSCLFLVAHNASRVLPTIRSRCRTLTFSPLDTSTLTGLLQRHEPALSEADATALAGIADGSLGRALNLHDAGGLEFLNDVDRLLGKLPDLDRVRAHAVAEKLSRSEQSFETGRWVLTWWMGQRIRTAAVEPNGQKLEPWLALWENTARLMDRASAVHLDKKRVFMDTFASLQRCSRA